MIYLLLANLYLCVFYACYHIFLRKETFFRWNRFYLLGGLFLAFTMPSEYQGLDASYAVGYQQYLPVVQVGEPVAMHGTAEVVKPTVRITPQLVLIYGYLGGCIITFFLFLFRLFSTLRILGRRLEGQAYSFFNFIRIDPAAIGHEKISQHEQVHVLEWHSLDVLLMQLVKIFNWFNPVVYLYERAMKLQHEYIADDQTAAYDQMGYAELLVSHAMGVNGPVLTNEFSNKRILKSRVAMLLRDKSPRKSLLRYALLVPVVVAMVVFSIACNHVQSKGMSGVIVGHEAGDSSATAFKKALVKSVQYSDEAMRNHRQGLLGVAFEKIGENLTDVRFLNEFGHGQEAEVARALQRENVKNAAPAGKHMVLINFKLSGVTADEDDFPPPIPISPDYKQLGEIVIVGYGKPVPAPPSAKLAPPKVDQARMPEPKVVPTPPDTTKQSITPPQSQWDGPPSKTVIITLDADGQPEVTVVEEQHDRIFLTVEIPPEPSGGMRAFMEYIAKNYPYPKKAMEVGVNGQVQVSFVVEVDGSLSDIKVVRDLGHGTGEAAVRVLENSSKWSPGIQNGRPVRVAYTLPIRLNLQS